MGKFKEFVLLSLEDAAKARKAIQKADGKYYDSGDGQFNSAETQQLQKLQTAVNFAQKHPPTPDSGVRQGKNISRIFAMTKSKKRSLEPSPLPPPPPPPPTRVSAASTNTDTGSEARIKASDTYTNKALKQFAKSYRSQYDRAVNLLSYLVDSDRFAVDLDRGTWALDGEPVEDDLVSVLLKVTHSNSKSKKYEPDMSEFYDYPGAIRALKLGGVKKFMLFNEGAKELYAQQPLPYVPPTARRPAAAGPALLDWAAAPLVRESRALEYTPAKKE